MYLQYQQPKLLLQYGQYSHHVLEDQLNVVSPTFIKDEMCVVKCAISTNWTILTCFTIKGFLTGKQ